MFPIDKRISEEFNRDLAGVISDYAVPRFMRVCYEYVWADFPPRWQNAIYNSLRLLSDRNILGLEKMLLCSERKKSDEKFYYFDSSTFEDYLSKFGRDNIFDPENLKTVDHNTIGSSNSSTLTQFWESSDYWDLISHNIKTKFDLKTGFVLFARKIEYSNTPHPYRPLYPEENITFQFRSFIGVFPLEHSFRYLEKVKDLERRNYPPSRICWHDLEAFKEHLILAIYKRNTDKININ